MTLNLTGFVLLSPGMFWVRNVCKGYQQMTIVAASEEKIENSWITQTSIDRSC